MEIRFIKKAEWPKLLSFNKKEYGPKSIFTNKLYYNWQFDNFANKNKNEYTVLGLFNKNKDLVGTFGMFFLPYKFNGKNVMANCMANLIIKEEIRNLGLGYMLLDRASSFNDLAIDHSINIKILPMFTRSGWLSEDMNRYVYILNPRSTQKLMENSTWKELIQSVGKIDRNSDLDFLAVNKFNSNIDKFWSMAQRKYLVTVDRSKQYLNWRYCENPFVDYKIFTVVKKGKIKAYVILRIEKPRKNRILGIKVCRIIDFVSLDGFESFALSCTINFCKKIGVDLIDYFTNNTWHDESLRECGFVKCNKEPYSKIPLLFNPVSTKRMKLNFAVKLINKKLSKKIVNCLDNWYTTKGDGDQDRPY